jgi:hypothetical protein
MPFFDKIKSWFAKRPANANAEPAPPAAPTPKATPYRGTVTAAPTEAPTAGAARLARAERARLSAERARRLEEEARSCFDSGDPAKGIELLQESVLLARHEQTSLPCLCRKCLLPDLQVAESGGVTYVRDFVVAWNRVLFYWMPEELSPNARQVRASMRAALRRRLFVRARRADEVRQGINPFTREPIAIHPRQRHVRDPFTGKTIR